MKCAYQIGSSYKRFHPSINSSISMKHEGNLFQVTTAWHQSREHGKDGVFCAWQ